MKIALKRILSLVVAMCICCTFIPQMIWSFATETEPQLSSRCETVIHEAAKETDFGAATSDLLSNTAIKFSSSIDLSGADAFEFDVYIEDIDALKAFTVGSQYIQFGFSSKKQNPTANFANANISSQLLVDGWNHIEVLISDFEETEINWSKVYFVYLKFADETQSLSDNLKNKVVKFKNICESMAIPKVSDGDTVIFDSVVIGTLGENENSSLSGIGEKFKAQIESADLTNYDFLKTDFYIPDYSTFSEFMADKKLSVVLLSENGKAKCEFGGEYNATAVQNWYRIKLPLSDFVAESDFDISKIIEFRIEISGEEEKIGDAYSLGFGFSNISVNQDRFDSIPEFTQSEGVLVIHEGASLSGTYENLAHNTAINLKDFGTNTDISNYSYFEFDFYVDDLENLKQLTSDIRFNIADSSTSNQINFNFIDKLTQNGWNHVKLKASEGKVSNSGKLTSVRYIRFRINKNDGVTVADADRYKLANICATKDPYDIVPEMIEAEDMLVIHEGAKLSGTYKNLAHNTAINLKDYGDNTDISKYDFFEFDFYVENLENLKQLTSDIRFNITDKSGANQINYNFIDKLTHDGWNHVKLKVLEGNVSNSGKLSSVRYVRFRIIKNDGVAVADADRYKLANVCATVNPFVSFNQSVTVGKDQSEIIVTWLDTIESDGKVALTENGVQTEFEAIRTYSAERNLYSYAATITGLKANTSYTYSIKAGKLVSEEYQFETQDFDDTFSFIHVSDVQYAGSGATLNRWNNTLSLIDTNFPDTSFIVNSGDVSDNSRNNDYYQAVKSSDVLKKYAVGVVPGNHDSSVPDSYYCLNFTSPNTYEPYEGRALNGCDYWYSYNNILFISLNSLISDVQYHKDFVTKVVEEQSHKFDWTIVNCHYSLFSASYHSTEAATVEQRESLAPLFSELGVDLVLSGHDHCYDRSYIMDGTTPKTSANDFATSADGVLYISATTASGFKYNPPVASSQRYSAKIVEDAYGFINYEVTEDEINITFYSSEDMSVLDEFTIYNDNGDHIVEPDSDLLKDTNLENVKFDSNGKYVTSFNATDISGACTIELDLGLATNETLNAISVSLIDVNGNSAKKDFGSLEKGWNHLTIALDDINGIDLTKIAAVELQGKAGTELDIANLYVGHTYSDKMDTTCESCDFERVIDVSMDPDIIPKMVQSEGMFVIHDGVKFSGTYNGASDFLSNNHTDYGVGKDFSNYGYFEFDFYVEKLDNLKQMTSNIRLNIADESTANQTNYNFIDQLTKNGWNHVKIKVTSGTGAYILNRIRLLRFRITKNDGVSVGATDFFKVANICATLGEGNIIPDLPENVVTKIDEMSSSTLGDYFGYTQDRIFKQKIGPYDFSKCNTIEFDIYIDDYDLFKQSLECERGAQFSIAFSSCPESLFGQYEKPRFYYAVQADLQDKITKTGWNHIKLSKDDFKSLAHTMDWSNVTSFMIRYPKSKLKLDEIEKNPAGNVLVKVANIVNTGILSDVPYDEKQEAKPDKNAIYINDAEELVDDNGSWNPSDVYVDENYKTENSHSVLREISYLTDPLFARMFFLFDYTADMSDITKLKFDLFIDLPQFIQREGNTLEIGLSSDRNFTNGGYKWGIDTSSLKEGWNSFEFDISSAKKEGNVSLAEIKTIFLNFTSLNLNAEAYESFIIGLDNLRYVSNSGNTTLKINGSDIDLDFDDNDDLVEDNLDYENDSDNPEDLNEVTTETITSEPKTIHLKETVNKIVTNYTLAIIILCAEFVALTAASIIAFIIIKKKKKK